MNWGGSLDAFCCPTTWAGDLFQFAGGATLGGACSRGQQGDPAGEEAAGLGQVGGEGAAAEQNVLEQVAERFGVRERNRLRALVADDDHQMVVKIFARAAVLLLALEIGFYSWRKKKLGS